MNVMTRYKRVVIAAGLIGAMMTGCATMPHQGWAPIFDTPDRAKTAYGRDYYDCDTFAAEAVRHTDLAGDAIGGLLLGAALGAMLGSVGGYAGHGAAYGSILGLASGAGQAAGEQATSYKQVFRNCMTGRGYRVLN